MILDISKWIKESISKEAKISHNDTPYAVRSVSKLPFNVKAAIKEQFSENFLNDADMVLFYKQPFEFDSKAITKLFELTNRALGKAANNMSKTDFKKLNLGQTVTGESSKKIYESNIKTTVEGNTIIIRVPATLRHDETAEFDQDVQKIVKRYNNIVFDFSDCTYISGVGINTLMHALDELFKKHGKMTICNVGDKVKDIFDMTGFNEILPIEEDDNEDDNVDIELNSKPTSYFLLLKISLKK